MASPTRTDRTTTWLAILALVLMTGYVAGYFTSVRQGTTTMWPVMQGGRQITAIDAEPAYGALPAELFAPLHYLDRHLFRPQRWAAILPMPYPSSPAVQSSDNTDRSSQPE